MKKKLIIANLALIVLCGCNRPGNIEEAVPQKFKDTKAEIASSLKEYPIIKNNDYITLKVPEEFNASDAFMVDSLIDNIWYVPLETNSSSLIQYIEKVIPFEKSIFILDMFSKVLLKFDESGKFIKQIGKNGKGPGEYLLPLEFVIVNRQILVWEDRASKIIYYDLEGNHIRDQRIGFRLMHFTEYDSNYVCEIANRGNFHLKDFKNYKLITCSPDWEIIGRADKFDPKKEGTLDFSRGTIFKLGNQLLYNPTFDYFFYSIDEEGIKQKYYIDVGSRKLPDGYDHNISTETFMKKYASRESGYMIMSNPFFETDSHFCVTFNYKGQRIPLFYSKESGRLLCNKHYSYSLKYPLGLNFITTNASKNTFIGYINPQIVVDLHKEWKKDPDVLSGIPEDVLNLAEKTNIDDNPILVFYTLKKF